MWKRFQVEEMVRDYRTLLRIAGFPVDEDTWRLAAHLQDDLGLIYVDLCPCDFAYMQRFDNGKALVSIPESLPEHRKTEALLEEIAHALLGQSTPGFRPTGHGETRLSLQWEEKEEAWAEMFRLMWKLPAEIVLRYLRDERGLMLASGCSPAEVRKRCQWLI